MSQGLDVEVEEQVARLAERVDDLEEENRRKNERIDELEETVDWLTTYVSTREEETFGEWAADAVLGDMDADSLADAVLELHKSTSPEQIKGLRQKQLTDHRTVKRDLARLRRQLNHVAEETDVDLLESVPGDDKIAKVVKDGVASVETEIHTKHERAELVLQNLADWGTLKNDANGPRVLLTSGKVREKLQTARDESLQSSQVYRVLDQIHDWGEDSTRLTNLKKKDGSWRLKVGVSTE